MTLPNPITATATVGSPTTTAAATAAPAAAAVADPIAWPLAERLAACLCDLLAAEAPVACCCVQPGRSVPWDDCTGGQAWVRIASQFATDTFPIPASRPPGPCGGLGGWAVVLELAVIRCMPTVSDAGVPPSCAAVNATARQVADDKHRMLRAIECCDWRRDPALPPTADVPAVIIGAWTPVAEGDCTGGVWSVTVSSEACVCNEPVPVP